jgi:hypothetical protein
MRKRERSCALRACALTHAALRAVTPECAVVKMMLCLAHPDLPLGQPIAGEL